MNLSSDPLLSCFVPVIDAETELLILGSLPGEASLKRGQYYGHPRNQFWRLTGDILGCNLVDLPYEARLMTLLKHHIGLWDVIATAKRQGSLDGAIREATPNPLVSLIERLPQLKLIAFNGQKAASLGQKTLQKANMAALPCSVLPSSSPAHAIAYERKKEVWLRAGAFVFDRGKQKGSI
ncbi:MAG: DNA-deoxyinosine glycosylase [Zymomonas mobilis subsp. pomaceae]|uniref:Uracil-DNA glycosylase superfamily n=1 Tax=Zymomonas mobilis subsp. pomaceae (strain ATCC 29192 / DSM 22645 / JCM 10191 / CCUG 17912 / NBRC 13757 / NCIMB 11200 / NRRL B-4491 / Barker I) TaxID=579138 RepID=F8EW04_ZYMMT|nr:DNA-deoxyinosine glycosylase [Zymomonas mobilis]AEI38414.1 Uracil-DNA glycosylase superfamily [Zymomonas mobilis subsp. pomaceae ATCC 29192]MDX5948104.1 DNA-deoxyinosine glycosylase [Zymomonas mobilis subsp. pomaceae]GEB90034.1 DNA-deoxyinosine glycosylase [Zymomonas mobilis subsp. pomaceae]